MGITPLRVVPGVCLEACILAPTGYQRIRPSCKAFPGSEGEQMLDAGTQGLPRPRSAEGSLLLLAQSQGHCPLSGLVVAGWEPSPCTCRGGQRRGVQRRQLRGWEGGAREASGVPLSVHFFFRTLLRFGGSALAVAGCLARERDGLHIPRRLESMWGTPERGRGGQKHPGSGLVHSEPGERPPTPAEVGLHIVHFQTGTHPAPKKENRERGGHGARLQRWRSGERGPGVNTRPLRPHWPFFQARRAGLQAPHQGPAAPLLWQLQGSWLREVLPLRLWKVRGLLAAHGSSGWGPPL